MLHTVCFQEPSRLLWFSKCSTAGTILSFRFLSLFYNEIWDWLWTISFEFALFQHISCIFILFIWTWSFCQLLLFDIMDLTLYNMLKLALPFISYPNSYMKQHRVFFFHFSPLYYIYIDMAKFQRRADTTNHCSLEFIGPIKNLVNTRCWPLLNA